MEKPPEPTVCPSLCLAGAVLVRGVGGIDSWGTDVEEPYHVSGEEDHSVSFRIVL